MGGAYVKKKNPIPPYVEIDSPALRIPLWQRCKTLLKSQCVFNRCWPPYICSIAPPRSIFQIRKCYSVGTLRIDAVKIDQLLDNPHLKFWVAS